MIGKMDNQILIPPPPSEEHLLGELKEVSHQYKNRFNPEFIQEDLDKKMAKVFSEFLRSSGEEKAVDDIKKIGRKILPTIMFHKEFFNSKRPSELAKEEGIDFEFDELDSAKTRSYPSGHTAQALYIALTLGDEFPHLKDGLLLVAQMISESRIDRGVHFPSDNNGGVELAKAFYEIENYKDNPNLVELMIIADILEDRGLKKESSIIYSFVDKYLKHKK